MARIASVACLSGKWSGLLLKSKVLWWWLKHRLCGVALCIMWNREPHTPVWTRNGRKDLREGLRFLLSRSGVSGFTCPDEFDLCGCCCCEAPRFDRTIRVRWSHSLAHLHPKGWRNALFRHYNPLRVDRPWRSKVRLRLCLRGGLERLEFGKDYLLPWFMTEIQFPNTWLCDFDCIPIYGDIVVWGINAVHDWYLWFEIVFETYKH